MMEELACYLETVHLKGYKSIEDLNVELKDGLNIVIGENGTGKSNFLELLDNSIQSISPYGRQIIPFKFSELSYKTYDNNRFIIGAEQIGKKIQRKSQEFRVSLRQKLIVNDKLVFDTLDEENPFGKIKILNKNINAGQHVESLLDGLGYDNLLPLFIRYTMGQNIPCVSIPATVHMPLLQGDDFFNTDLKTNFISTLFFEIQNDLIYTFYQLKLTKEGSDEAKSMENIINEFLSEHPLRPYILERLTIDKEIIENLHRFTPIKGVRFNENINIYNDNKKITIENLKFDYLVNDRWIPWSQLSDGTRRMFYIISETTYKKGGIVLMEEPELGIHPHQFELLMTFLKEQSRYKQFIITTHSPKTLDHLDQDELDRILITTYDQDKGTAIQHMSEEQKLKAKDYMKKVGFLSDYWLMSDLEEND